MKYILIHGLGASKLSFKSLARQLPPYTSYLEYEPNETFDEVFLRGQGMLEDYPEVTVIGHSLGGILAWHLAKTHKRIVKGVSIATPFGGFSIASLRLPLFFIPSILPNMLMSLDRNDWVCRHPRNMKIDIPWINFVANKGMTPGYSNDGVLTTKSQDELKGGEKTLTYVLPYNHYEIPHCDELFNLITNGD